jgi:hypothetical protein
MYGFNYLYDDNDYLYSRQLPTASTSPGYPTMPTSPVKPMYPMVPSYTGIAPAAAGMVTAPASAPVLTNPGYTQAFLRTQIGKRVRIEFLIGTNTLVDRGGILEDVGISYIVLRDTEANNRVMGDLYSIKFVTFYE